MKHEERKRELAEEIKRARELTFYGLKPKQNPERGLVRHLDKAKADLAEFHDDETALLEADVIARARDVERAGATGDWGDDSLKYLHRSLAALDAHAAKREGKC